MSVPRVWPQLTVLVMAALIVADVRSLDAQCSMCRTLLATPEGEQMAAALRSGIWILLAAPLGAFGVIAVAAIRSRKRFLAGAPTVNRSAKEFRS